jgi:hypothetical protein
MAAVYRDVGRVLLVRWIDPTLADLAEVRVQLKKLGDKLGARPVYIAITPSDSTPPTDSVRKEMMNTMQETSELTDTLHLVLEGSGLKFSALRSIVASMFLVSGNRRTFVHDNVEHAMTKARLTVDEMKSVRDAAASMARGAGAG